MDNDAKFDAFLSYATADRTEVIKLKEELESHGIILWFDKNSIRNGAEISEAVKLGIEQSRFFIACLGSDSGWTRDELSYALQLKEELKEKPEEKVLGIELTTFAEVPFRLTRFKRINLGSSISIEEHATEVASLANQLTESRKDKQEESDQQSDPTSDILPSESNVDCEARDLLLQNHLKTLLCLAVVLIVIPSALLSTLLNNLNYQMSELVASQSALLENAQQDSNRRALDREVENRELVIKAAGNVIASAQGGRAAEFIAACITFRAVYTGRTDELSADVEKAARCFDAKCRALINEETKIDARIAPILGNGAPNVELSHLRMMAYALAVVCYFDGSSNSGDAVPYPSFFDFTSAHLNPGRDPAVPFSGTQSAIAYLQEQSGLTN
jgi:hypothetical protein